MQGNGSAKMFLTNFYRRRIDILVFRDCARAGDP